MLLFWFMSPNNAVSLVGCPMHYLFHIVIQFKQLLELCPWNITDTHGCKLQELLELYHMEQVMHGATHEGICIDLIMTNIPNVIMSTNTEAPVGLSNKHSLIECHENIQLKPRAYQCTCTICLYEYTKCWHWDHRLRSLL